MKKMYNNSPSNIKKEKNWQRSTDRSRFDSRVNRPRKKENTKKNENAFRQFVSSVLGNLFIINNHNFVRSLYKDNLVLDFIFPNFPSLWLARRKNSIISLPRFAFDRSAFRYFRLPFCLSHLNYYSFTSTSV